MYWNFRSAVVFFLPGFSMAGPAPANLFIPFPSAEELLQRPSGRPFTISVEGNVGAGKSTLLGYFKKYSDISVHTEPLDIWQNLNGTDFLDLAYTNPQRWGMTFESLVTLTMAEIHLGGSLGSSDYRPVKVMERSVHSARACFIENIRPSITGGEMAVLESWYDLLTNNNYDMKVDLIIYLKTSPEVALTRVRGRQRSEEQQIQLEFFTKMHRLHEDWLIYRNSSTVVPPPQVLVINADQDISVLTKTYSKLAKMIWKLIPKEMRIVF